MPARAPTWESPYSPSSAEYLASLRNDRPARPTGSRPAPFKSRTSIDQHVILRSESAMSLRGGRDDAAHVRFEEHDIAKNQRSIGHRHSMLSERSMPNLRSTKGRPCVQAPSEAVPSVRGRKVSPTATVEPAIKSEEVVYKESGTRWLERQEAHALRQALEVMDAKEEEMRIHQAAQDEAADLVWRHQHPGEAEREVIAGYRNQDLSKKLKSHLARGAHERSQSDGYIALGRSESEPTQLRTVSEESNNTQIIEAHVNTASDKPRSKKNRLSDAMQHLRIASGQAVSNVDTSSLGNFSGGRRRMSGQRITSNKSMTFPNSEDKIFEEPELMTTRDAEVTALPGRPAQAFRAASGNTRSDPRPLPQKSDTMPTVPKARPNPFDRHRRQAEQPKASPYTTNNPIPPRIPDTRILSMKDEKEIRSDDIRAATSMKKSDRSSKLPTPTAVSDRAGRPIVSFDPAWTPPFEAKQESRTKCVQSKPDPPAVIISAPTIPTINVPNETSPAIPTINLPDDNDPYDPPIGVPEASTPGMPTFSFDGPEEHGDLTTITALPAISAPAQPSAPTRPVPQHTQSLPAHPSSIKPTPRLPWLNKGAPTATCASCTLPISGRIVTASDSSASNTQRALFHPSCFTCHHCSELLEAVAFYPEPDGKRLERLQAGHLDSQNDPLRFYCHLDFHEFFSPRCRSCKTPVEGEVIVAAGAEYHVGHFFCAECGDPFAANTPFVEKGGYAYCVPCHRKRTSDRCRGCKKLILDEGCVQALGGEWHEGCFRCDECEEGFGDEGRFFVREVEVSLTEKERRRGVAGKREERAVCGACEERRLKQ